MRTRVPRSSLGHWEPAADRPDPLAVLAEQDRARVPELVPLRHERMAASPFAFYRGAAAVFSADQVGMPRTGLDVQLCGDAHLANFGLFASPDRELVFDLNDFDETLPGPFEWDLRRLAASFEVAGRARSFPGRVRRGSVERLLQAYLSAMRSYATMPHIDVWYDRLTAADIEARWGGEASDALTRRFRRLVGKARSKDRLRAFDKLTTVVDGEPRFRSDPPVLVPALELLGEHQGERIRHAVGRAIGVYRRTLPRDRRSLLDRYRFVDLARKVVGVGSVGTRCWVALLVGDSEADPLFLQVKEATASVLEPYLGRSAYGQHGQRVVEGQRLIQSSPDVFLGWERLEGVDGAEHDYYFRQLWDWKGSPDLETIPAEGLAVFGELCGTVLARAHARTGDSTAIAAYLGGGRTMVRSMQEFAVAYADQNERDHAALVASLDR